MSNVIQFKPKGPIDTPEWIAGLSVFKSKDNFSATVTDASEELGLSRAEMMRLLADSLEAICFMARQQAEEMEPSEKGQAMAVFTVYADGSVRSRMDEEKMVGSEHFEWAADCLDLMSAHVRAGKM